MDVHLPHHHHHTPFRYQRLLPVLWGFAALLFAAGFLLSSPREIWDGLWIIIRSEDALITDYVHIAGPGAALVNSALVTAISLCILYLADDVLNGMTLVVIGLMSGFSLFGKNIINVWPILLGTWLYTRYRKEPFGAFANIALMATALAPIVSYIALDDDWGHPIWGVIAGLVIGFVMPPLSAYTFRIQNGMNLYNVGFACGLLAFIFVPLMSSLGADPTTHYRWASGYNTPFALMLGVLCLGLIAGGLFLDRRPVWAVWAGYRRLLQTSGRAPSDYLRMFGHSVVMVNSGINGLLGMAFILAIGGSLNGPTVGGILTLMGFSAFGKHAFNILPVMAGVALGSVVMHWSLSDPTIQLACLFCTTLAPVSGYFGWPYGVLAGFLHSSVVLYTGSPVAGMNLYNNGFSGGLIAIVLYPAIIAIARRRKPVLQEEDYFENMEHDEPITPPIVHEVVAEVEEI